MNLFLVKVLSYVVVHWFAVVLRKIAKCQFVSLSIPANTKTEPVRSCTTQLITEQLANSNN